MSDLRARQLWFHELVTSGAEGLEGAIAAAEARSPLGAGGGLGRALRSGAGLSAEAGVAIYRNAYRSRLVECLADDYPALQYAIGDGAFDSLARDYVERHPSRSPSLNAFGRHLPAFCRERAEPWAAFAAELAELEWALVEVLHAPAPPPWPIEALAALPPEAWAGARLRPSPALRLLRFRYPVDAFLQAFREGREPALPGAATSATAVYRQGPRLWRQAMTPPMAELLGALVAGRTLGEALAALEQALAAGGAPADAGGAIMQWFRGWVAAGFFAGLEAPGAHGAG
ncbi:MAG TPA: DNA-binding domain-containing protein [Polyangiaceae bacterium]|nr:DNA-binding domain-containing protein [Polyangiaceae bacterium]